MQFRPIDTSEYPYPISVGVDLGQRQDFSAIVACEQEGDRGLFNLDAEVRWIVRGIDRLPTGTPYNVVADRVAEVIHAIEDGDREAGVCHRTARRQPTPYPSRWLQVVADTTGVGRPVCEMIEQRLPEDVPIHFATFTGGESLNKRSWKEVSVAKSYMVSRLKALLQTDRLILPKTELARALADELLTFELHATDRGVESGAFKTGAHDDLVCAIGLSVVQSIRELTRPRPNIAWPPY